MDPKHVKYPSVKNPFLGYQGSGMKTRLRLGLMLLMALNSGLAAADRFEDEINNYF
jgi:hypothetical protein